MRDIVWLIADLECEATIRGFLERPNFHLSLGCNPFRFSVEEDRVRDTLRKDPGVWKYGHELLSSKLTTHRYAVIILDNAWDGSPGPAEIEADISRKMVGSRWKENRFEVIVIDPELEAWIWQDNPLVEQAIGHVRPPSLRQKLATTTYKVTGQVLWPPNKPKPPDPKAAVETVRSMYRLGPASPVFKEITSRVSVNKCQDPAFQKLRAALQRWFPPENP
jgi:hypothetical protein